ncbi:hypothetical protein BGX24_003594 [Mortierella sp. AD032]|nr:hypothetical protein BGX24_003594 [Mortierella sp. AD032]
MTSQFTHSPARTAAAIQQPSSHPHSLHPSHTPSPIQSSSLAHLGSSSAASQAPQHLARPLPQPQWTNPPVPPFWPPQQDPRVRVFATPPPVRVQHRKRHKVATSCNRCRSNKRKCDGGVPCASCLKKNVDCRYTDAQLSRATWGDSLLSDEKVIGVVADKPRTQLFYTGVNPLQSQDARSLAVYSQSRQHSRVIQVTHPGPQWQTPSTTAAPAQGRIPSHNHGHQQQFSNVGYRSISAASSVSSTEDDPSLPVLNRLLATQHPTPRSRSWVNGYQEPSLGSSGATVGQSQSSLVNSNDSALEHYATKRSHAPQQQDRVHDMDEESLKARRVHRMAKDLINIKKNEFTLLIPRHILHEDDELFVVRNLQTNSKPQRIPPRLMAVPRDANFLVEVFFEHAHFYYPVLNRAVVELCLMEPHTPSSMLLLSTVFMVACKHLPRTEDTLRAIEFRERVRELRWCIEDPTQLNFMLAEMLGFMAVYGLCGITPGMMEYCGTHRTMASKESGTILSNPEIDGAPKDPLPEVTHQSKLWLFWAHYLRDSIAKLYFGYHFGMDAKPMTAELPKIKNFVGLGGRVARSNQDSDIMAAATATTKKRREFSGRGQCLPDKRVLHDSDARISANRDDRTQFRGTRANYESDESGDDDDSSPWRGGSEAPSDVSMPSYPSYGAERRPGVGGANYLTRTLSALSKEMLEAQSRGDSISYETLTSGDAAETLDPQAFKIHMERMEILLRSQEDATDGGSYARALFLEEVRLWTIGRRLSAYLASRTTTDTPIHLMGLSSPASSVSTDTPSSVHEGSGVWSEQAWAQDQELQNLQADLIAWERSIPDHLRFRSDVDHPDVNHKVNGKMSYYTITILLQTAYLPDLPDPLRSKTLSKKPSSQAHNQDGPRNDAETRRDVDSEPTTPPSQRHDARPQTRSAVSKDAAELASSASSNTTTTTGTATAADVDGYYNTAHRICTELSNVVFHHIEIMLERYTRWCSIQAKINHALIAAQRVVCLNARLNSTSATMRDEAKAGFKMGSDLYKRLALLPGPLVYYDRPPVEDIHYMNDLDKVFEQMVISQNEERENQQQSLEQEQEQEQVKGQVNSQSQYVIDTDDQDDDALPTADEIHSQGLQIFGGEGVESYAFEFEETSISMKGSFSLLLDPHTVTE